MARGALLTDSPRQHQRHGSTEAAVRLAAGEPLKSSRGRPSQGRPNCGHSDNYGPYRKADIRSASSRAMLSAGALFDLIQSERDRLVGQMYRKSLSFIVVETKGLDQQVTDGCATDDSVPAKPTTGKRGLWSQDEKAISVGCDMLGYDDGALLAVTAPCFYTEDCSLAICERLNPIADVHGVARFYQLRPRAQPRSLNAPFEMVRENLN
jgi:hypothetical protein